MSARIREAWGRLGANALLRNSAALVSGTVVTQAIVFLFSPLLARLFALADFGDLANYNAWASILALVSNLRYEHAIIVAKGRDETNRVIALTGALSFLSALLYAVAVVALVAASPAEGYLRELRRVAPLIPVGVLAICVSSLLIQYNVKRGHFRRLATVGAVQVVFTLVPQVALGLLHVPHALILGTIAGYVFSSGVFAVLFVRDGEHDFAELRRAAAPRTLLRTAAEHANFPRYMLGADGLSVLVQQFIPAFVLALYNPAVAGLYSFSIRIVRVPLLVISTAVAGALRKEAMDATHAGGSLAPLFSVTVRSLFLLSLAPFVVVVLYGPQLFSLVFGAQWVEAGRIVQILSPGILTEFVALPLAAFFLVTGSQRYTFRIQLAGFGLLVAALAFGRHYFHDFLGTCYLISAVMVGVNLASLVLAARVTGAPRPAMAVAS